MDKEKLHEWKKHPVTEYVFDFLKGRRDESAEYLAYHAADNEYEFVRDVIRAQARIQEIDGILNMEVSDE